VNFYGILFLILPLFSAFLAPLAGLVRPKHGTILNMLIYAAGAVMGFVLLGDMQESSVLVLGGWRPPFGINLYLSPVSLGFGIVVYVVALLVHVYDLGKGRSGRYNLLFSLFVFASLGMMQTGDLFNLFIFIEIGSIALIALVPSASIRSGSRGALKYLVPSGLLSMFMLASIALLYSSLGTLNIAHIAQSGALNTALALLLGVGMLLMLFFESELFPFNSWVPDVYKGAPSSFSAAVAGIGGLAAAATLGRIFLTMMWDGGSFQFARGKLQIVVFVIASASILFGELAALRERDLKKVLGFSSAGQMGIVVLAFALGGSESVYAGIFLLLNHSIVKPMLLMLAGFFIGVTGRAKWDEMSGVGRQHPLFAALFILGGLSLMGMPIFAGFWGKLALLKAFFTGASALGIVAAVVVLISVVLEGVYLLRIGHSLFERDTETDNGLTSKVPFEKAAPRDSALTLIPAFVLALITVFVGVLPGMLHGFLARAAEDLVGTTYYIERILATVAGGL
jgi:formate hydrogenlyase subunit 3/multisubunit Na+/H+ antiporter MnhD subunit